MQGNRGTIRKEHWYEHVTRLAEKGLERNAIMVWNQQVQTDRTIPNNRPDIIMHDTEKGTCMLIDAAISGDRNVWKK